MIFISEMGDVDQGFCTRYEAPALAAQQFQTLTEIGEQIVIDKLKRESSSSHLMVILLGLGSLIGFIFIIFIFLRRR